MMSFARSFACAISILACLVAPGCGDGDGGSTDGAGSSGGAGGYCPEGGPVVMCMGDSNCAFDPAAIDCNVACSNLGTICAASCPSAPGCTDYTMDGCLTGCNFAKNQACPNVTFGCEAMSMTCDALDTCVKSLQ